MQQAVRLPVSTQGAAILAGALGLAILSAPLAAAAPAFVILGVLSFALVVAIFANPPIASYVLLAATPLVSGVERGHFIPVLRPSEAVAILVGGGLLARAALFSDAKVSLRIGRLDAAILFLVVTGSIVPVMWMLARGRHLTQEDLLYAFQLWKFYGVFLVVRASVKTERQVRTCLWVILASTILVAFVAILQSLQLFGVPGLLSGYLGVQEHAANDQRGASTIGSSLAVADVMIFSLAIAAGWLIRGGARRGLLVPAAIMCVFGVIAAGQFSGYLSLLVAVLAVGLITRTLGRSVLALLPVLGVAGIALRSVVAARLSGFSSAAGIPSSWQGRLDNLRTFFWPELTHNYNWILGVRPAGRIKAPETWRDWVYIESGHTYLLWTGGVPHLIAFFVFLWAAIRRVAPIARQRVDAIGVAAIGSFTALTVLSVVMVVDPHHNLRGSADLNFALLALALVGGEPVLRRARRR
jgi:hypothetical protein